MTIVVIMCIIIRFSYLTTWYNHIMKLLKLGYVLNYNNYNPNPNLISDRFGIIQKCSPAYQK